MADETVFLDQKDQHLIVAAIKEAELQTSGEIKVHIEKNCNVENVMDRAQEVFGLLSLHETVQRNGVLFYLAYEDRKFAVLGDIGIHQKVMSDNFWESTKDLLRGFFSNGAYTEGFCAGIREAGLQLKKHFPYSANDINELPDDISFG